MGEVTGSIRSGAASEVEETIAARYRVTLLITGQARGTVEAVARRIHTVRFGDGAAFVTVQAGAFPCHSRKLRQYLARPIQTAAGGSIFIKDVEEMASVAQDTFVKMLSEPPLAPPRPVCLMAGTTVSLLERIELGQFKEGLFYRLNVMHLVV